MNDREMQTLYDTDIVLWSEEQAALLRRIAAEARLNDPTLDWTNIIEEIESVGRSQVEAVESLLFQALVHMLKAEAWPLSLSAPVWRADALNFRSQARRRFVPSMRRRLDIPGLYRDALRGLPESIDGQPPLAVSAVCSLTLDDLLAE
jgi:hypothetical protein